MPIQFQQLCKQYGLKEEQCEKLKQAAKSLCPTEDSKGKPKRELSKWQLCIKEKRKGKSFDPNAMKRLSKLYKKGKCPTVEFLERVKSER